MYDTILCKATTNIIMQTSFLPYTCSSLETWVFLQAFYVSLGIPSCVFETIFICIIFLLPNGKCIFD
jgi:hypothetical protein